MAIDSGERIGGRSNPRRLGEVITYRSGRPHLLHRAPQRVDVCMGGVEAETLAYHRGPPDAQSQQTRPREETG